MLKKITWWTCQGTFVEARPLRCKTRLPICCSSHWHCSMPNTSGCHTKSHLIMLEKNWRRLDLKEVKKTTIKTLFNVQSFTCQRKSNCATPPLATPVQRTVPRSEFGIGFSKSGFGIDIHSCASKWLQQNWDPKTMWQGRHSFHSTQKHSAGRVSERYEGWPREGLKRIDCIHCGPACKGQPASWFAVSHPGNSRLASPVSIQVILLGFHSTCLET